MIILAMVVYYIAFWMPSEVVSKIFGLQAGYVFQNGGFQFFRRIFS